MISDDNLVCHRSGSVIMTSKPLTLADELEANSCRGATKNGSQSDYMLHDSPGAAESTSENVVQQANSLLILTGCLLGDGKIIC